ncbi:MAG: hypothetical protein CMM50_05820 [Rhodospirillaceae bacterium]|nr:hypothetical protein [Rhodospirillaceae bacterium]
MVVAPQAAEAQTVVIGGGGDRPSVEVNMEALGIPNGAYGDETRFDPSTVPPLYRPGSGDVRSRIVSLPGATSGPQRPPLFNGAPPQSATQSRVINLPSPTPTPTPTPPNAAQSRVVNLPSPPRTEAPAPVTPPAVPQPPAMRAQPRTQTQTAAAPAPGDVYPVPGGTPMAVTPEQLAERRAGAVAERPASPSMPRETAAMRDGDAVSSSVLREQAEARAAAAPPPAATAMPERPRVEDAEPAPAMAPPPTPRQVAPAAAPPAETQMAAVAPRAPAAPQPAPVSGDSTVRLTFASGDQSLPGDATSALASVVAQLKSDDSARAQLMAYAEGDAATASAARRLSLFRALKVREYLIEQGIKATRIDVRALGANAEEGPADRVDVVMMR